MTTTPRVSTFDVTGGLHVRLRHMTGEITVTRSSAAQCTVTLTPRSPEAQPLVDSATIAFDGRDSTAELDIKVGRDRPSVDGGVMTVFWGFKFNMDKPRLKHEVDVLLEVPEGTSVDVKTVSGDLHCTRASLGGAELTSVSGNLTCDALHGSARVKSTSGTITLGDVRGAVDIKTVSGSVSTGAVHGEVDIKTVSGSIAACVAVPAPVAAKTISGDIVISVVPGLTVAVDAKSISGRLRSTIELNRGAEPEVHSYAVGAVVWSASPKPPAAPAPEGGVVGINAQSVSGDILIQTAPSA